jgi:putative membrane fusion protein
MVVGKRGRRYLRVLPTPPPRKKRSPWRWRLPVLLLLTLLVAGSWYLYQQHRPAAESETVAARFGEVKIATTVDGLVLRDEVVLNAPTAGTLEQLVPEGRRVRPETPVAKVGATTLAAPQAGNVAWEVDGLEAALNPGALEKATPDWFHGLTEPQPRKLQNGTAVQAGQPVGRLVVGGDRAILALVPASALPAQWDPDGLHVAIPSLGWEGVPATTWKGEGSERLLVIKDRELPDALAGVRKVRLDLTFALFKGIILPRTAVDVREGRQGVWVLKAGRPTFVPGKVKGFDADHVAMDLEIEPGTPVLRVAPSHPDTSSGE